MFPVVFPLAFGIPLPARTIADGQTEADDDDGAADAAEIIVLTQIISLPFDQQPAAQVPQGPFFVFYLFA